MQRLVAAWLLVGNITAPLQFDFAEIHDGEVIESQVRGELGVLEGHAELQVSVQTIESPQPGFVVEVVATDGDEIRTRVERQCLLCTETELVDRIVSAVHEVDESLAKDTGDSTPSVAARADERPTQPAPPPLPKPQNVQPAPTQPPAGRGLIIAGGAVLGLGVATTAAGVALFVREPTPDDADPRYMTSTTEVGAGLLAAGAATTVAAITLTTLGIRRRSKRSREVGKLQVASNGRGVVVRGRF